MKRSIWLVVAAMSVIMLGSMLGTEVLEYRGLQHKEAEIVLARVESLAQHLLAIQRRAEADQGIGPVLYQEMTGRVLHMRSTLEELTHANIRTEQVAELKAAFERYNLEAQYMYDMLLSGLVPEAAIRAQGAVDPLHAAFARSVAEAAETHRRAGLSSYVLSVAGSALLTFAAAGAGFLLLRRYLGIQHEAEFLAAEQRALLQGERRIHSLLSNSLDVVVILDQEGIVTYTSPAITHVMGYQAGEWLGRNAFDIIHPDDHETAMATFRETVASPGTNVTLKLRLAHADQSWRYVEVVANNLKDDPAVGGIVVTYRDVTQRQAAEAQLAHLAFCDALTGLPNRVTFEDRLTQALTAAAGRPGSMAVMFLDLDNFKVVNDSLGHQMGDKLLVGAAKRLQASIRADDMAARLGGDEFTILLENLGSPYEAHLVARRVQANLCKPFSLEGREVVTTASIGIAYNSGEMTAGDLLRNADGAMYQAKRSGRARHTVYTSDLTDEARERLELESDLRRALERDEFRLHYQPCVELKTGRIVGVEALLRWEHPVRGLLAPGLFVPIAEETGLIRGIGLWALNEACQQRRAWLGVKLAVVERMEDGPEDRAILRAILTLAETLNLQVTAEGIETETQCRQLMEMGCIRGQGYYFARPCSPERLSERLATQARLR